MQMARTPVNPALNLPQAILDLATQLKDKKFLQSLVATAQAITAANKLTEEEADNLEEARVIIAQVAAAEKRLAALQTEIAALEKREATVAKREANAKKARELLSGD